MCSGKSDQFKSAPIRDCGSSIQSSRLIDERQESTSMSTAINNSCSSKSQKKAKNSKPNGSGTNVAGGKKHKKSKKHHWLLKKKKRRKRRKKSKPSSSLPPATPTGVSPGGTQTPDDAKDVAQGEPKTAMEPELVDALNQNPSTPNVGDEPPRPPRAIKSAELHTALGSAKQQTSKTAPTAALGAKRSGDDVRKALATPMTSPMTAVGVGGVVSAEALAEPHRGSAKVVRTKSYPREKLKPDGSTHVEYKPDNSNYSKCPRSTGNRSQIQKPSGAKGKPAAIADRLPS